MRSKKEQEEIVKRALSEFVEGNGKADITEGPIVAVLICSHVLEAEIWFALRDDWRPDPGDDIRVIFYASELPFLQKMTETAEAGSKQTLSLKIKQHKGGKNNDRSKRHRRGSRT